jgi:TIGR03009 family protein
MVWGQSAAVRESAPSAQRRPATNPSASPPLVTQALERPNGPPDGGAQAQPPQRPQTPAGFPLPAKDQQRVDQILNYWQDQTGKIKTFECKFIRNNWDDVFKKRTADKGTVRYSAPDKGLMRVDQVFVHDPQAADPAKPWRREEVQFGEYWVCDGEAIYQFDSVQKKLIETRLPDDLRGQAIAEGPLPFLFGARAETMKQRYWIREATPQDSAEGTYVLEAIPKRQEDAANFERIAIKLELIDKQLMPTAMKVFNKQNGLVTYYFQEHQINDTRHRVAQYLNHFVRPKTPAGWTKVVEEWAPPLAPELDRAVDAVTPRRAGDPPVGRSPASSRLGQRPAQKKR